MSSDPKQSHNRTGSLVYCKLTKTVTEPKRDNLYPGESATPYKEFNGWKTDPFNYDNRTVQHLSFRFHQDGQTAWGGPQGPLTTQATSTNAGDWIYLYISGGENGYDGTIQHTDILFAGDQEWRLQIQQANVFQPWYEIKNPGHVFYPVGGTGPLEVYNRLTSVLAEFYDGPRRTS